ncbi:MAG: hypothetical protein IT371_20080 [Deltaproteobacteria bacterium]|nr:hypothetical protein [Deltaproteobacteria bacterium]
MPHGHRAAVLTLAALALVTGGAPARANLRAPVILDRPASTGLMLLSGEATLRRAGLAARCDGERCSLRATYEVHAASAERCVFALLVPEGAIGRTVRVNGKEVRVASLPFVPRSPREKELVPQRPLLGKLVRAAFEATLPAGTSRLELSYAQGLSAEERGHGYFSKGRFLHRLEQHLWPLKGWTLAPDFDLAVEVRLPRSRPGWWKRTFGKVRTFRCVRGDGQYKPESPLGAQAPSQQGEELVFAIRLGRAIPDRLTCSFGDDDLLR